LFALLDSAVAAQPVAPPDPPALAAGIYEFIVERLRAWYLERPELTVEIFESVRARKPASLLDFDQRLKAVAAFARLDDAASLAAANKRIGNILRQAGETGAEGKLDPGKLSEPAEQRLHAAMQAAKVTLAPLVAERAYTEALTALAALREPVDRFFDDVMVMTEDQQLQKNRLALLAELRGLFLDIADVSRLSIG
ncbi:MAG: DALR anticodon-binding domain-containing protein, partial [Woeseiaceae bacterium]